METALLTACTTPGVRGQEVALFSSLRLSGGASLALQPLSFPGRHPVLSDFFFSSLRDHGLVSWALSVPPHRCGVPQPPFQDLCFLSFDSQPESLTRTSPLTVSCLADSSVMTSSTFRTQCGQNTCLVPIHPPGLPPALCLSTSLTPAARVSGCGPIMCSLLTLILHVQTITRRMASALKLPKSTCFSPSP